MAEEKRFENKRKGEMKMITDEAKKKRAEYNREYRNRNRERINAKNREWHKNNPDKNKSYIEKYWNKKVMERNKNNEIIGNGGNGK